MIRPPEHILTNHSIVAKSTHVTMARVKNQELSQFRVRAEKLRPRMLLKTQYPKKRQALN